MYCRNCGAQIPEGNRFCENCGTPVPDLMQSGSAEDAKAGTGLILHHGMRKRTIILVAVIAALVIGGIAGGITAAVSLHHASGTYQDKIDEGNQYLDSEQYDDALSAFDDAIAIEPKKPDGYIGKANVQSRQGKHQDAIETLTVGKKNVTDDAGLKEIDDLFQKETRAYEGEWKTAYRQVLQDYEFDIRAYEDMEYGGVDDTTALCDLNEDGTMELLFFAEEAENALYRLRIYTYRDGKAQEVSYTWTPSIPRMGSPTEGYRDVWAGGGTKYIVYKEKGTKGVTIYSTMTDEFMVADLGRYQMSGQTLKALDVIGYDFDFVRGDTYVDQVDPALAEYFRDTAATSREDYDGTFTASRDAMDEVIFCSENGARGDDAAIWEKAEGIGALAEPLDAMLEELTVPAEAADTDEAGAGGAQTVPMDTETYRLLTYDVPSEYTKEGSEDTWLMYTGSHSQIDVVCQEYATPEFEDEFDVLDPDSYSVNYYDDKRLKIDGYDALLFKVNASGEEGDEYAGVATCLHIKVPGTEVAFTFIEGDFDLSEEDEALIDRTIQSIRISE